MSQMHTQPTIPPVSGMGHQRTFSRSMAMSALPPKADIGLRELDVRFVPIADIGCRQLTWLRTLLQLGHSQVAPVARRRHASSHIAALLAATSSDQSLCTDF